MRVFSFVRKGIDLETIEIELTLVPGLPTFHVIGLPDVAIKESILRIKSALRHQGFKLPTRDQVIIHLKPSHEKKSSQGLDLAIAAAYLMKTEQVDSAFISNFDKVFFYGEVTLEGTVAIPPDLELLEELPEKCVLITGGVSSNASTLPLVHHGQVSCLQELTQVKWCEAYLTVNPQLNLEIKSRYEDFKFGEPMGDLLAVAATGEHNVFVAGPAGTGKTTFSEVLHELLRQPTHEEQRKIDKISRLVHREKCGRPYINPHHSATDIALLGGGVPPYPGEITRAQHGVLALDEYLEFQHYVKESLREPVEKHQITICRSGAKVTFPADFLLVAMTNLCPCGEYVPGREAPCGSFSTRCKSYYMRMSGPLLDRFEIVSFSHIWKTKKNVNLTEIQLRVKKAQQFAFETRGQTIVNSRLNLKQCEEMIPSFVRRNLLPEMSNSHRRLIALYRVARTVADLESSEIVNGRHIESAKNLTIQPFKEIKEAWR